LAVALLGACQNGDRGAEPTPDAPGRPAAGSAAIEGLCRIEDEGLADRDRASAIFYDRAHDALHELAAEVEDVDRAAAARLLVAKERVEQALGGDPLPETFLDELRALRRAVAETLDALGEEAPGCPR
jgi:hypothetical protein